jgi:hypothetical protein
MNKQIRPIDVLLFHLFSKRRQISPERIGKIDNPALAKETVDTYLNVIQAIQKGEQYFELNGASYRLPKEIPAQLMAFLPIYLEEKEREQFLEQMATGNYSLRGVTFVYQSKISPEQRRLEREIETYLRGDNCIAVHVNDLNVGLPAALGLVHQHSLGDVGEDLEFAIGLVENDKRPREIRGKERFEILGTSGKRKLSDPEIRRKYDRLMEIYASQQPTK